VERRGEELEYRWTEALPEDWDDWVRRHPQAAFSHRSGFLESLAVFPGDGSLHLLEARTRTGVRRGGFPVYLSRRFGRVWARSLPFGTYGGPLVDPGVSDRDGVVRGLVEHVAEWARVRRVVAGEIVLGPLQSADASAGDGPPPALEPLTLAARMSQAHLVDLAPGPEALRAGLHRESRRALRVAEGEGVRVEEDASALHAVYDLYLEQAKGWGVRRPYPRAFLARLLDHRSGFARLYVARRGREVLTGALTLFTDQEAFVWVSGAAPAARPALAFGYLLWKILETAASLGCRRYNVGSSGGRHRIESFKSDLGARPERLWILHLRPHARDPVARLIQWARAWQRPG